MRPGRGVRTNPKIDVARRMVPPVHYLPVFASV